MASLIRHVRDSIDSKQYYTDVFPDLTWPGGNTEARVLSLWSNEKTPSLSINPVTGAWYSHSSSDQFGGNSIVSFHAALHDCTKDKAAKMLYHQYVRPVIDDKLIRTWHRKLLKTPTALKYVTEQRLVSLEVIEAFQIGWNGNRFVIPVRDEFGICINAKLYDPLAKRRGTPKMLNYSDDHETRQYGSPPMLFPLSIMKELRGPIIVCEGEWDVLALLSIGIDAVTTTAGGKSWPKQFNELFRAKDVVIASDNDEDGDNHAKLISKHIMNRVLTIKRIEIPSKVGKDVTDWMAANKFMRTAANWGKAIKKARLVVENKKDVIVRGDIIQVPLDQASKSEWYKKRIRVDALVSGKDTAPYMLPKTFRASCSKQCEACPLAESQHEFIERDINPTDPDVLKMIDAPEASVRKLMLNMAGMNPKPACRCHVDVVDTFNVEQILLIPTLDTATGQYVMRSSYFVGHGIQSNRAYRFEGTTVPNPRDQHGTHLFDVAKPVQDEIETFELTNDLKGKLKRFRPGKLNHMAFIMSIAEWQSRNVTKIHERPDLHVAIDLAFHSTQSFIFNREIVARGMLDILILGDTRCGKGYVTEGLSRYYGLGEIASGENCTFAGLVGGLQQVGNRWLVTWGLIPLNHNRIVVIDEASSLSDVEIGRMSRVRSEGIAEISKIVRESTRANTRLIWLSNPRSGRPIMSYNSGIETIKELMGANEDVSRLDFALTVASDEVPSEIINAEADYTTDDADQFPRELCRALILWAWSRRSDQIKFTDKATTLIIQEAIKFGKEFSSTIPLVQAENIRIKIAKVSAAVAARTFSSDKKCESLIIKTQHVRCACEFMRMANCKPSMAYDRFSRTAKASKHVTQLNKIGEVFAEMGDRKANAMEGLLELHHITPDSLSDYAGDMVLAKTLIGDLVRCRCLSRIEQGNWYLKNPAFTEWLRQEHKK